MSGIEENKLLEYRPFNGFFFSQRVEYFLDCETKVLNKRLSVIKHGS